MVTKSKSSGPIAESVAAVFLLHWICGHDFSGNDHLEFSHGKLNKSCLELTRDYREATHHSKSISPLGLGSHLKQPGSSFS